MKKIITFLSICLLLTSCAIQIKPIEPKNRTYDDVPLNALLNNEIGDRLITTGKEYYQEALKIIESPNFKIDMTSYPYTSGEVLPLSGSTNEWFLYYNKKDIGTNRYMFGIAVNKKNTSIINPFLSSAPGNAGGFFTKKVEGFKTEPDTFTTKECNDCFKQEFVFNGKVGNNLKFIYREYVNDMARPAFNQDLQYDLNDSNIVGFKGLRIEVIKATNTNIEYKILSSFNKKN